MKKYKGLIKIFIVILFMFVCGMLPDGNSYAVSELQTVQVPEKLQSIRKSDTSIQIGWESIPGVDGYIIYKIMSPQKNIRKSIPLKMSV